MEEVFGDSDGDGITVDNILISGKDEEHGEKDDEHYGNRSWRRQDKLR